MAGPPVGAGRPADRSRRPHRPSGDDRERAILSTAERLLAERSLGEISVDDLARGAGISRPTFYFYFPSKEAVVLSLLDRVADEARAARSAALEGAGEDVPELWRRGLESILHTFRSHRALTIALSQMLPESDEARKLWARIMEGFADDIETGVRSEQERGAALSGLSPRQLAIALNWMTERTFHAALTGQEPSLGEDEALDVLLLIWSRAIYGDDHLGR